jgi:hypothetical protein
MTQFGPSVNLVPLDSRRKLIRREPLKHDKLTPARERASPLPRRSCAVTVCIAAIAARGKAIVPLADSAISLVRDGQTVMKADAAVRKVRELADDWVGLISGALDFGEQILSNAQIAYRGTRDRDVSERIPMPELVQTAYQIARTVRVSDTILIPRMLDEAWYKRKASRVSEKDFLFTEISNMMGSYDAGSTLMICGFHLEIPEIHLITNPGVLNSENAAGFGVIGIGEDTARNRLFTLATQPTTISLKFYTMPMMQRRPVSNSYRT